MIRKKGSLIIENMLSSAMIIILILGICQVILSKDKWHEIKNKEDEFTRITYAVEEELKYNLSIEEIKNLANSNVISLSKDNILKCLTTEGLEMIQKGDDIVILIDPKNITEVNTYTVKIRKDATSKDAIMQDKRFYVVHFDLDTLIEELDATAIIKGLPAYTFS